MMVDGAAVYHLFSGISVISGRLEGDFVGLYAMKRIQVQAFSTQTRDPESKSVCHSAMLLQLL